VSKQDFRRATHTPITAASGLHVLHSVTKSYSGTCSLGSTPVSSHPHWPQPFARHGLARCYLKLEAPGHISIRPPAACYESCAAPGCPSRRLSQFSWTKGGQYRTSWRLLSCSRGPSEFVVARVFVLAGTAARLRAPPFKSCWRYFAFTSAPPSHIRYVPLCTLYCPMHIIFFTILSLSSRLQCPQDPACWCCAGCKSQSSHTLPVLHTLNFYCKLDTNYPVSLLYSTFFLHRFLEACEVLLLGRPRF
jgi:hypothetical protein